MRHKLKSLRSLHLTDNQWFFLNKRQKYYSCNTVWCGVTNRDAFVSVICTSWEYELRNRNYTNQMKFPFGPDTTTRWYAAIAFPLTVYLSDHHFRNTSLTSLLYSRSSHTYVSHIRKSRISPQLWCMFPILCPHRSSNSMYSRVT